MLMLVADDPSYAVRGGDKHRRHYSVGRRTDCTDGQASCRESLEAAESHAVVALATVDKVVSSVNSGQVFGRRGTHNEEHVARGGECNRTPTPCRLLLSDDSETLRARHFLIHLERKRGRDRARFNSSRHGAQDRSHEVAFVGTLRTNVRIHSTDPTVW